MRRFLFIVLLFFLITACDAGGNSTAAPYPMLTTEAGTSAAPATTPDGDNAVLLPTVVSNSSAGTEPATGHPRLWLTPADVERLRGWATPDNPMYAEGLALLAERAKTEMDEGRVPDEDCGQRAYTEYATESHAQLFAFMSLIDPNEAAREDYAQRARTLLMHVMNAAAEGPADPDDQSYRCPGDPDTPVYPPFRDPRFFTEDSDRPRWYGEAFALTVDWIYPTLTAEDKATINTVFTRWGREIIELAYHHPEPIGVVRDPILLQDRSQVRWSGNNYFAAHMRNLGMMSMAMDPADSSPELQGYLANATGAWLYIFDEGTRTDARGGLLPEGFEYSPQTASYVIQFLWALKTAGQADPTLHGPEVVLDNNPFWNEFVVAFLHSLSPGTVPTEYGTGYVPAFYGDAQVYELTDFIAAFGALGAYDTLTGNTARLNMARWIETHTPPGGEGALIDRARSPNYFRDGILYFMLFDPAAAPAPDPRPSLPTDMVAEGVQRLYSRTDWGENATWFIYALPWGGIDHQMADGNHIEFFRNGEWLTKARTGYPNIAEGIASSEFRNAPAIENSRPVDRPDDDWRIDLWRRGSQWNLVMTGDPGPLNRSFNPAYTYAAGDATNLYNSENEGSTEVVEASRAVLWLKPDVIVVYDRADSPAGRFKRAWWQLPTAPTLNGTQATMTTLTGQQLFITALLPEGATLMVPNPADDNVGETVARNEPMTQRLRVDAPDSATVRFLHVLEGADSGTAAQPTTVIRSSAGTAYEGAAVAGAVVMFPMNSGDTFTETTYTAPAGSTHYITGLTPGAGYDVTITANGGNFTVTVRPGGPLIADSGGVVVAPS
jgi:hypothetical protein